MTNRNTKKSVPSILNLEHTNVLNFNLSLLSGFTEGNSLNDKLRRVWRGDYRMFLVGLTGGIASGKSSVSDVLKELGCPIIDADVIAREGETTVYIFCY